MPVSRGFHVFSTVILVTVFLVILAGGVVRMTQSGMGCPDWPTCFGRWIPPTDESQLPANYKELYKFKYVDTSFNPYHTWIEYINRLLGALLGVLLFIQFLWSLKYRSSNPRITWMSFALLIITGFQGWLGSKVVEHDLAVAKVTTHMLVALIIAVLAYQIVYESTVMRTKVVSKFLPGFVLTTIALLIIQVVFGTAVREQVDEISLKMNFESREKWIEQLDNYFLLHRSFSLIVASCCFYLFFKYKSFQFLRNNLILIVSLVTSVIVLGISMNYFSMPAIAQPLHLLFSSILVVVLYSIYTKSSSKAV